LRAPTSNPPGSTAPGSVTTTRSPTAKLLAPQITPCGSGFPTSTWHQRMGFLNSVSSSISRTRPTTTGPVTSGAGWISSISRPTLTNASPISSADFASMSTYSASQDCVMRTALSLSSGFAASLRSNGFAALRVP
jgi:hypothetical protein